jgi:hypothetical protein
MGVQKFRGVPCAHRGSGEGVQWGFIVGPAGVKWVTGGGPVNVWGPRGSIGVP